MQPNDKTAFRQRMLLARGTLSKKEQVKQSGLIMQRILAEPTFQNAKIVFSYCSYGDEIDTYSILHEVLARGKTLCIPRTLGHGVMQAHAVQELSALQPSKFGILEPTADCALVAPSQIDVCLIPCLAADYSGHRLGYGGGYYDRYLPKTTGLKIILCAQSRLFLDIPHQDHDIACDIILTEEQVVHVGEA